MKTDKPPGEDHRRDIQQLICKRPTQGAKEELHDIRRHGDCIGKVYALSRKNWSLENLHHGLDSLRASIPLPDCRPEL